MAGYTRGVTARSVLPMLAAVLACGPAAPRASEPVAVGDPNGPEVEAEAAESAPTVEPALPPIERALGPQHDMVYELARLDRYLVLGAQGGASVIDVPSGARVAAHDEFICNSLAIAHDAAWAGCDKRVLRWTATEGWREYLKNDANDADYHALVVGPQGELEAGYGSQQWRYDPSGDAFVPMPSSFAGAYDATYFQGELWTIRFMNGVARQGTMLPISSATYPARDPRRLTVDSQGRLYAEDFGAGLLRWDGQAFQPVPGLTDKGTGVGYDGARDRLWMLHYTDGLKVSVGGQVVRTIDLRDLTYMRSMLLEPDGSVWVAGWPGLVRVRWDGSDPIRDDILRR